MLHDKELVAALEPGQLTAHTQKPLPRRHLGTGILILLWALRIYVLVAVPLVGYAFLRALQSG